MLHILEGARRFVEMGLDKRCDIGLDESVVVLDKVIMESFSAPFGARIYMVADAEGYI